MKDVHETFKLQISPPTVSFKFEQRVASRNTKARKTSSVGLSITQIKIIFQFPEANMKPFFIEQLIAIFF